MSNLLESGAFINLATTGTLRSITPFAGAIGTIYTFPEDITISLQYRRITLKEGRIMQNDLYYLGYKLHSKGDNFRGTLFFGELDWLTFTHPESTIKTSADAEPISVLDYADQFASPEAFLQSLAGSKLKIVGANEKTYTKSDGTTFTVKYYVYQIF